MSALDARLRESLRRQVARIQSELGITTLYVTHDQAEALAISDRVAVMHDGRIEQVGRPQAVYREPATRFVAEFVGDNNVFEGDVRGHDGAYARVAVGGETFEVAAPGDADRITFCVRPGSLERSTAVNRLPVTVETSEFLGETVRVNGRWNGTEIVLQLPAIPDRDELTVGFAPEDAHVVATK
jgi:thiamine transport system ATP-binding protein